jgi:hypothetical protein
MNSLVAFNDNKKKNKTRFSVWVRQIISLLCSSFPLIADKAEASTTSAKSQQPLR